MYADKTQMYADTIVSAFICVEICGICIMREQEEERGNPSTLLKARVAKDVRLRPPLADFGGCSHLQRSIRSLANVANWCGRGSL